MVMAIHSMLVGLCGGFVASNVKSLLNDPNCTVMVLSAGDPWIQRARSA
jgi:hypothetical protein